MNRTLALLAAALLTVASAHAIVADSSPRCVVQPDGTTVTLRLSGDEHSHYTATADGYTVLRRAADGAFVYAVASADGSLAAGTMVAHDPAGRSAAERALLATLPTHLRDAGAADAATQSRQRAALRRTGYRAAAAKPSRGLLVLIQFSDCAFKRSDVKQFYTDMINKRGYSGYTNEDGTPNPYGLFPGSARDYFYDNSGGQYDPQFDVYGPVTVSQSVDAPQGTDNTSALYSIFRSALTQLNSEIDYTLYDEDKNGEVDMVYFLFAGTPSSSDPLSPNHLWPHESNLKYYSSYLYGVIRLDNKTFGRYSCSTELYGSESMGIFDGIGTFCHEFGHALGLMDHYDTDGAEHGTCPTPDSWDLMSSGNYNNTSRTPAGLSLFERYQLGWVTPDKLTAAGSYILANLQESNRGYIMPSPTNKEFFTIENRQRVRWDSALPGHGLIITRVDSTNGSVWAANQVNIDPARPYLELLRAAGVGAPAAADPFPGSFGVSMLDQDSPLSLRDHNGTFADFMLHSIVEQSDGSITFNAADAQTPLTYLFEDFETLPLTTAARSLDQQGRFATWTFSNANVMAPTDTTLRNGIQSVGMYAPALLMMTSDINVAGVHTIRALVHNTSTVAATFRLYASTDGGTTWTEVDADNPRNVAAGAHSQLMWTVGANSPVRFRIYMPTGTKSKSSRCYIDDLKIYYSGSESEGIIGDLNNDGVVDVTDLNMLLNHVLRGTPSAIGDLNNDTISDISDVNLLINSMLTQ